ncbi:Sec20-domain-containing protein [Gymnopilus junonius]|uniref:Sec20-domain-containing protein n=1 Tax=Gymnopilus junonius TaxID=109634 RepID=A0A9P5TMB2_GYMJU|nr:Sec20-domain-containing protein [Gymnopilus junonius]
MPPIPSRLPEEALSLISDIDRRHNHISQVEIPALRKCTGPLAVQQSLAEDVRQDTILLTRQVEDLDLMVDDLRGEKNRKELREMVTDFREKLDLLRVETRAALLSSKKAIDQRAKSNRDELLASASVLSEKGKSPSNEKSAEDTLMKANSDVTYALRRTIALMQTELERSVLSTQILQDSTSTLRSASQQHDTLSTVMYTSKQLVTALEKSDWLDRVLILSGFFFFLLVVALILKQRIVDRGLRIAFWWTRFIPSFSDDAELLRSVEKDVEAAAESFSSVVVSAVSSIIPTASMVLSSSALSSPSSNPHQAS